MGGGGGGVSLLIVLADCHVRLALSVGTAGLLLARFLLRHSENTDLSSAAKLSSFFFSFCLALLSLFPFHLCSVCPTKRRLKFSYWQIGHASFFPFFFPLVYVDCFDLAVVWLV